jgi:hypothetical protein
VLVRIASFNGEEDNSIYRLPTAQQQKKTDRDKMHHQIEMMKVAVIRISKDS